MTDTRTILVFGEKTFKVTVPEDSRITFGPWSPPNTAKPGNWNESDKKGTLRIYQGKSKTSENIIAVFTGVTGFRDISLDYEEQVVIVEGSAIWKSDQHGYSNSSKSNKTKRWVDGETLLLNGAEDELEDD